MNRYLLVICLGVVIVLSCGDTTTTPGNRLDLTTIAYSPEAYELSVPDHFPDMIIPEDNPMTQAGVTLGRHLFYDPILSVDSTLSCSSCHLPQGNFTDNQAQSVGVNGDVTTRSSMTLLNIGFVNTGLFWDGKVMSLEDQALLPVEDPIELHESWPNVEAKLQRHDLYPMMFRLAFGIEQYDEITRDLATKAIAQFERSLVSSGQSKYDRVVSGQDVFSDEELRGHNIFFDIDPDVSKHLECGHCHNAPLFTTNEFINNGLQVAADLTSFDDLGRGAVTGVTFDNGTFRVPTLRNIFRSAPYMHDGSLTTLQEVMQHYESGGNISDNIGAVLRPLSISPSDLESLMAFLRTLEDQEFLSDPRYQSPFQ